MLHQKPRPATYADIEALPAHMVGEILFGMLHAHPRPAPPHGVATDELRIELGNQFGRRRGGPGGWFFMIEPALHLGKHVIVPDIAGWKRERVTPLPETSYFDTVPDWICEVLSPSTQKIDRTDKLNIYASFGVGHCWYVDPIAHTLEVLALVGDKWQIAASFKDSDSVTAPPFEAHTFPLDVLWEQIDPTAFA